MNKKGQLCPLLFNGDLRGIPRAIRQDAEINWNELEKMRSNCH